MDADHIQASIELDPDKLDSDKLNLNHVQSPYDEVLVGAESEVNLDSWQSAPRKNPSRKRKHVSRPDYYSSEKLKFRDKGDADFDPEEDLYEIGDKEDDEVLSEEDLVKKDKCHKSAATTKLKGKKGKKIKVREEAKVEAKCKCELNHADLIQCELEERKKVHANIGHGFVFYIPSKIHADRYSLSILSTEMVAVVVGQGNEKYTFYCCKELLALHSKLFVRLFHEENVREETARLKEADKQRHAEEIESLVAARQD